MTPDPADEARRERNEAWNALTLVLGGVVLWGGAGWLVSQWLDNRLYTMLGLLLGAGGALYLVWVRYGKA